MMVFYYITPAGRQRGRQVAAPGGRPELCCTVHAFSAVCNAVLVLGGSFDCLACVFCNSCKDGELLAIWICVFCNSCIFCNAVLVAVCSEIHNCFAMACN